MGVMGASKTYHAVIYICLRLVLGRVIATNIDLVIPALLSYIERRYGVRVDPAQIIDLRGEGVIPEGYKFDRKGYASKKKANAYDPKPGDVVEKISFIHLFTPPACDIVIDEAHTWFDVEHKADTHDEVFHYLTHSRKDDNDLIFITQHIDNIDRRFKRLFESIWTFRDMEKFSIPGLGRWFIPQFKITQKDRFGNLMNRKLVRKDKEVYALYKTTAMLSTIQRAPIPTFNAPVKNLNKRKKMIKFYFVLICVAVYFMVANGAKVNPLAPWVKQDPPATASKAPAALPGVTGERKALAAPLPPQLFDDKPLAPFVPAEIPKREPLVHELAIMKTGDFGGYTRTSIGPVYVGALTPLGRVVDYSEAQGTFSTVDALGDTYRVIMLFPSYLKENKLPVGSAVLLDFKQQAKR